MVLRALRAGDPSSSAVPRRVRVELPLPPADVDTDELLYLGLHGQAADWSGGMQQRFRVTKGYVENGMLEGKEGERGGGIGALLTRQERDWAALVIHHHLLNFRLRVPKSYVLHPTPNNLLPLS